MNDSFISEIRLRATNPETQTDLAQFGCPKLPEPALRGEIEQAERLLGFRLWPEYSQVLLEIANGGFGPGDGLLGVPSAAGEPQESCVTGMREMLLGAEEKRLQVVPLCDWGSGIWSCLDCQEGQIGTLDEHGLTVTGKSFGEWLVKWAQGVDLWSDMGEYETIPVEDPKSGQKTALHRYIKAKGLSHIPRSG